MAGPPVALKDALADRYELIRELGEGGMATVYLAEDLKHHRKVAVKVLKPELAAVVGGDRFLAEIETTANLQHPNILPLFDSGEANGFLFFVMPYVEGETLRDRLDREKQLPVDDAVRIAMDLAEALDYAHRRGVIHRDIKPANVLLQEGRPLIADFGIAIAVGAAGGARLTETGLSVGTPFYMSPEQATGDQAVGPATDTYALGCVLYEMLVGEPPYYGATAQAVLGKIIAGGPVSATVHRTAIPAHVDAAIRCALERLPADRFADARAFARALGDGAFRHGGEDTAEPVVAATGPWKMWALAFGASFAGAVVLLALSALRPGPSPGVLRYLLDVPIERGSVAVFGNQVTISPDGSRIAYVGRGNDDPGPRIWVRQRGVLEPQPVFGTEGAHQPFFSPDGSRIGFITEERQLRVASLGGEPPITLVQSGLRRGGGSWGDDGFIYFMEGDGGASPAGLRRVPESGGPVEVLTTVDTSRQEVRHYFPDVLPGSRAVLFTIAREDNYRADLRDVAILDLETREVHVLFTGMVGHWSPSGHILSVRADGALLAVPLDQRTFEVGPAVPLFEGVQVEIQASTDFDLSLNGTLVYAPGGIQDNAGNRPVWVERSGGVTAIDPSWTGDYGSPRISPDGTRLALDRAEGGAFQVWVKELDQGPEAKLTFQGDSNYFPAWTPDGSHIAFVAGGVAENSQIHVRRADAAVPAEVLLPADSADIDSVEFSPDGEWLLFRVGGDVYARRTAGDAETIPLLTGDFVEASPTISPDGRWVAFTSSESGNWGVYVRPFPNVTDGKWLVSPDYGVSPRWSPDGTELFYRDATEMISVEVLAGTSFVIGEQRALFEHIGFRGNVGYTQYDVHPDGNRFVMIQTSTADPGGRLLVVENFFDEIAARLGG